MSPGRGVAALLLAAVASAAAAALAQPSPVVVVGDGIPQPLTATPGDATRGRALVAQRQTSLCLLCHSAPLPEVREQGDLAGPLAGAGSRWTAAQLRLRLVDARRLNPDSPMPAFHRVVDSAEARVGTTWAGRPVLDAQQVEDLVAWLQTLKD